MNMRPALANRTRFTLFVGITGHLTLGLITLFLPGVIHNYLWPPPLEPVPNLWLRYDAVVDLAFALGGVYAFQQNNWIAVRTFLFTSGGYVTLLLAVTIVFLLTVQDQPLVIWLYVLLAFLYLPLIFLTWRKESGR